MDMLLAFKMFALVLSWIGSFFLCFGPKPSGQLTFPLLFLFGLVPLPKIALDSVIALLQIGSAWSAHAFFAAFGVPVFQQGVLLTIPGLTVQVAQECSSIRSSSMLFATSMVLAQILLCSFWRKAFIVVLALPLSILKNGLRIFVIAMLGTRVDPGYLTGRLHHQGGALFFAIALAVTVVLISMLRKGEHLAPASRLEPVNAPATKK
jgi:exosortase